MGDKTGIAWTDATWNPTRGYRRVSPGCEHCYAERTAIRMSNKGGAYEGLVKLSTSGPRWTGDSRLVPELLLQPIRWQRPRRIFVDSMSDLFFEGFSNEQIAAVFGAMAASPRHIFQVLTKRPERMEKWLRWAELQAPYETIVETMDHPELLRVLRTRRSNHWPLHNVHLGVSVEDQPHADERIPALLRSPASVRFVSYEPALGPVRFHDSWMRDYRGAPVAAYPGLDWIIVGGESGSNARPFDLAWGRSVVAQCKDAGIPCFVKQMGSNAVGAVGGITLALAFTKKGGDPAEWPPELRVQEFPTRQRSAT